MTKKIDKKTKIAIILLIIAIFTLGYQFGLITGYDNAINCNIPKYLLNATYQEIQNYCL